MIDYYEILEVSPNANTERLKQSYLEQMARHQPARYHGGRTRQLISDRVMLINEAYRTLSNPRERRRYDAQLARTTGGIPVTVARKMLHPAYKILAVAFVTFALLHFAGFVIQAALATYVAKGILLLVMLASLLWLVRAQRQKFSPDKPE